MLQTMYRTRTRVGYCKFSVHAVMRVLVVGGTQNVVMRTTSIAHH